MKRVEQAQLKKRRSVVMGLLLALLLFLGLASPQQSDEPYQPPANTQTDVLSDIDGTNVLARSALAELSVKGRAPKTGYSRDEFGSGWASIDGCDVRNIMLQRGLENVELADDECTVLNGTLNDPYTGKTIQFVRGSTTSADVQIDHVVALSDAWQKGAQELEFVDRVLLANDPLNLLAVDGDANQQKGDSDAASWLPSNKGYRCLYVARQIAVKRKYELWVSSAEKSAMERVLNGCGEQVLPVEL